MTATVVRQPTRLSPLVLLALLAGPLLSMVDGNVVNVAIPDIVRELHSTLTTVQWVVSGYLLALAATLPATSWLAKRFGTTRVYAVSLAAFTAASLACSLAVNVPELIAFRVAQGIAAAPLVPLAMNLIFGTGTDRDRFPVSAGLVLFLGPALGPTVGGLLITAWRWPLIFLVNVPIGIAALAAVPSLRRHGITSTADRTARFDPLGLALLSAGLTLALYGTSQGPAHGWLSARSLPYWLAGVVLVAGYTAWALRRPHPAVDLRLLRRGQSALAVWLCVLTSVALFSVLFLLPILVQDLQRHGALASGLVLLPQGIVMGLSTQLGQRLGAGGHLRAGILAGLAAVVVTTGLLLLVTVDTPLWVTTLILAGRGLGLGLVIQPLLTGLVEGLPPAELADANTLFNVGQRLGGSVGVSLLATYFALRATTRGSALAGFHDTIAIAAGVGVVALLFALLLTDGARRGPMVERGRSLEPGRR
jgi:EmrB/QacA subfamily drug resistance transporter